MKRTWIKKPGKPGGMMRQVLATVLLIAALAGATGVLAWNSTRRLSSTVSALQMETLQSQRQDLRRVLFEHNPYLEPDTFYLGKLEPAFYFGADLEEGTAVRMDAGGNPVEMLSSVTAISNIAINIRKGLQYSTSLRSCYWMLADPGAPYVLINGSPVRKEEASDETWMGTAPGMTDDLYIEWRTLPLSYLNSEEVLTVYRRVTCESSRAGENISGYWVLNYHLYTMMNKLSAEVQSAENVYLYSAEKDDFVSAGNLEIPDAVRERLRAAARDALAEESINGSVSGEDGSNYYYLAEKLCDGNALITCLRDARLQSAVDRTTLAMAVVLLLSCMAVAVINVISISRHQRYNRALRKMLTAVEAGGVEQLEKADPSERDSAAEQLIDRILNNEVDLQELQSIVESERELKAELDALYGHVQINSHFLLNTLDSIYWASVSSSGADSQESRMIEYLCVILKYALDSSDLYTTLREEVECARMYLEIQRLRKGIQVETHWEIPEELMGTRVSKLMLQPVLENCIQHGMAGGGENPLRIGISARRNGSQGLMIQVEDNGTGIGSKELRRMNAEMKRQRFLQSRHIGLANVNRRLQVQFGGESGISLSASGEGGLCVTLMISGGGEAEPG